MKTLRRATVVATLLASTMAFATTVTPDAEAQGFLCTAGDETALANCIDEYNTANADENWTLRLTADIAPANGLPSIDNDIGAELIIDGQGYTIDARGMLFSGLRQTDGVTTIRNITLRGSPIAGVRADDGVVVIEDSTVTDNSRGVSSSSLASVTVINSTAVANGTGLFADGPLVVEGSTIAFNTLIGLRGSFSAPSSAVEVSGSLIAGHLDDCAFVSIVDSGGNVFGDDSCNGTATPSVIGTISDTLDNNGCATPCTPTLAVGAQSPAVDANSGCASGLTDQRGVARTPGRCDAGAFEAADCPDTISAGGESDLAFAIGCYNNAGAGSQVTVEVTENITLTGDLPKIHNDTTAELTIDGQGYAVDGNAAVNVLLGQTGGTTTIRTITLTGANSRAVNNEGGRLTIVDSTFTDNNVGVNGRTSDGTTIISSTFFSNAAGVLGSVVVVQDSTIVSNSDYGILVANGVAEVSGSLIAGNGFGDCLDPATDLGGNVFGDDSCNGTATPDLLGTIDDALGDNGCSTPCTATLALLPGSPAIDANSACAAGLTDQRGVTRTVALCDAGAFELGDRDGDGDGFQGPLGDNADCDDTTSGINPGAPDVAYNGVDEDCSGGDRNDVDGDGFVSTASVGGSPDCNDTNANIYPGATEIPANGIDEDCSGADAASTTGLCNGRAITIDMNVNGGDGTGTSGDDVILGTPDDDVINSGDGNDSICSGGGDDTVVTGAGNDWVRAGAGDDRLFGDSGDDRLFGISGNDEIHGGAGDDTIHGNLGEDTLFGDEGADRIFGYAANDEIHGGPGDDRLHGNFGEDLIFGDEGDDIIIGYGDDDILHGGPGNDRMHGNFGDDLMNGNAGNDTLWGYGDDDTINGGLGNDTINGNFGNDTLNGNQDNDMIQGAHGNDTINGGDGNDTLFGNTLNDTINGGPGTDTCTGGPGTDTTTNCEPNNQ